MFGNADLRSSYDLSVATAFEQQTLHHADRVSIVAADESLSYRELNAAANGVAERLLVKSAGARLPIATLLPLGVANIVGFMAVLKTGAAAVPLDPHWSSDTLRHVAEQSGAGVILASESQTELARSVIQPWQQIISLPCRLVPGSTRNPDVIVAPDDPAVILFTSGSTGRPKGVVDSHRNLLHEVFRLTEGLALTAQDRQSLLRANCAGAVSDICTALLNGATLLPYDVTMDGFAGVERWLETARPTVWRSTPSLFRSVYGRLEAGVSVASPRIVFLCGEPATGSDLELWRAHSTDECALVNCYGATEAATVSLGFFHRHAAPVTGLLPVGRCVTDMEVLIEDTHGRVVEGVAEGELLVRSRFLAHGYLNDSSRTAQCFIGDVGSSGPRLYRTGDIGLRSADGELTVLGRRRWQPGSGGPVVDLAVVEAALLARSEIEEAAAVIRSEVGGDQLMVCISSPLETSELTGMLRGALGGLTSGWQVTVLLSRLLSLPRTASGKIDRVALQDVAPFGGFPVVISGRDTLELSVPAGIESSPNELIITNIWQEVLNLEVTGNRDNFFDLGGQSVQAAQVISRLEAEFGVRISFREFFAAPTISGLSALIAAASNA